MTVIICDRGGEKGSSPLLLSLISVECTRQGQVVDPFFSMTGVRVRPATVHINKVIA